MFEEEFKNWTLDQKVEWALGPNICNLSKNMRSIIVDLKDENERLKRELKQTEAQDKIVIDGLRKENERLNGENAKLRCTALHAMIGYGKWAVYTCHYKYRHGIMYIRWCDFTDKVKKAYRKAKKELKEGK